MAIKTVLRNMLAKWGILSVEMQSAVTSDEKVFRYDDNDNLIEETTLDNMTPVEPDRKKVDEVPIEQEEGQEALFDDMKLSDFEQESKK